MYSSIKSSNSKIYLTDNAIHITQYATKHFYGYKRQRAARKKKDSPKGVYNSLSPIFRARKKIKLIIEANSDQRYFESESQFRPLFVTLTFGQNIADVATANKRFNLFIKRLNYQISLQDKIFNNDPQKYVVVPEFQSAGRVHYHIIFFKFPKIYDTNKFISRVWGEGFTFNSTIKSTEHLKNYMTKYFVKSMTDERLKGQKHYFTSRNIKRPQVRINQDENTQIIEYLQATTTPDYQKSYGQNQNKTTYTLYKNNPLTTFLKMETQHQEPKKNPPRQLTFRIKKSTYTQGKNKFVL